ncbi:MAG TPA: hypothetical protein VH813_10050 [Candidatus Limnocylindrales bacterium]|jgi:hypothetical protein
MDTPASPADELPALYREILDRLAPLERSQLRSEALRIRQRASRIYAQSWSDQGRKSLQSLLRKMDRLAARVDGPTADRGSSAESGFQPQGRPVASR